MKHLFTPIFFFLGLASVMAQAPYRVGDKIEAFSLKDSKKQDVSLKEFANSKTVVLVFTNTQCPYAKLYESRLTGLSGSYADRGVQFVFINPSVGAAENGETVQQMSAKGYGFPYLADEGQRLSARFGATKTPEVFVLHNLNGQFVLKYKGAVDDNPQAENFVKEYYLKNAIDAILNNQPLQTIDRRATGCMIRKM